MMHKKSHVSAKEKEVSDMPTIEMIEVEKTNYIQEMKNYLNKLQQLESEDAREASYQNLLNSGIIEKNGRYSRRYKYSRENEEE